MDTTAATFADIILQHFPHCDEFPETGKLIWYADQGVLTNSKLSEWNVSISFKSFIRVYGSKYPVCVYSVLKTLFTFLNVFPILDILPMTDAVIACEERWVHGNTVENQIITSLLEMYEPDVVFPLIKHLHEKHGWWLLPQHVNMILDRRCLKYYELPVFCDLASLVLNPT